MNRCWMIVLLMLVISFCGSARAEDKPAGEATTEASAKLAEENAALKARVKELEAELAAIKRLLADVIAKQKAEAKPVVKPAAKPVVVPPSEKVVIKVEPGEWGASPNDIRAVCLSSGNELWAFFPGRKVEPISLRHVTNYPMVIYGLDEQGQRRVNIAVTGSYWAQFAYQFAHEMCHIGCRYRPAKNPNLWFEESLCETASLFVLRRMSETWKTKPPYPNWKSYSSSLASYVEERIKGTAPLDGLTLAKWYARNEAALRSKAEDRDKNNVVAVAILPLLEKNPKHWKAIGAINQFPPDKPLTFAEYLASWHKHVDAEDRPLVEEIAKMFEVELPELK